MAISAMVPNPRTGADKKYIARSYTPVTLPDTKGYVELVIKEIYGIDVELEEDAIAQSVPQIREVGEWI